MREQPPHKVIAMQNHLQEGLSRPLGALIDVPAPVYQDLPYVGVLALCDIVEPDVGELGAALIEEVCQGSRGSVGDGGTEGIAEELWTARGVSKELLGGQGETLGELRGIVLRAGFKDEDVEGFAGGGSGGSHDGE